MRFLKSSFAFLINTTLVGLLIRAGVAFYLGYWNFNSWESVTSSLGAFWYGWHFDAAIAAFLYVILFGCLLVFNLGKRSFHALYGFLMFAYVVVAMGDALYAKESGRHISYEVYNLFSIESSIPNLLAKYWLPLLFSFLAASYLARKQSPLHFQIKGWLSRVFAFFVMILIALPLVRGFEGIPQDPSWAYRAGGEAKGAALALNGAYGVAWASLSGKKSSKENIVAPEEVHSLERFEKWRSHRGIANPVGKFDGNIVVVFLEGWPGNMIDHRSDGIEVIPFFNQLQKQSLRPELMLAGGHRTTEGIFATMCSMPNPPGKSIMFSEIENKDFTCLPRLLTNKGYSSAFFQGSDQYTSGVGLMVLKTGFQESLGKREIPNWKDIEQNAWGVFDHDLYKFVESKMDTMKEPMLIGINTNTTHDTILPKGKSTPLGNNALMYADSELREFYDSLKKRKWKKDWLLVLVADHTSYGGMSIFDNYAIPFLMKYHTADGSTPDKPIFNNDIVTGAFHQNDVAATLADITGTPAPMFLGRSMTRPQDFSPGASVFHLGESAWFDGPWVVAFNVRKYPEKKCFQWKTDMSFTHPLPCPEDGDRMYLDGLSYIKESQELLFK